MTLEQIKQLSDEIEKEIDGLWEIQSALNGLRRFLEFVSGVKTDAYEKRNK